jgi:hypothetical protein
MAGGPSPQGNKLYRETVYIDMRYSRYHRTRRGVSGYSVGTPTVLATAPVWGPFAFIAFGFRMIGVLLRAAAEGAVVLNNVCEWLWARYQARKSAGGPATARHAAPRSERMYHSDRR